jgi:hypothetical protein
VEVEEQLKQLVLVMVVQEVVELDTQILLLEQELQDKEILVVLALHLHLHNPMEVVVEEVQGLLVHLATIQQDKVVQDLYRQLLALPFNTLVVVAVEVM